MKNPNGPERKVQIINQLTHTKGPFAGQPFHLRPWQEKKIIRPLFKIDRRTGKRQYRTCLLMMPRKNGKTELVAALAIDGLLFDGEIGAEVYSAAADKDQAALVFNVAAQMIRNDPELLARLRHSRLAEADRPSQDGLVLSRDFRRGVQQTRVQRVARASTTSSTPRRRANSGTC